MKKLLYLLLLFLVSCTQTTQTQTTTAYEPINTEINYLPDGTPYLVHPEKLLSGGPPKDGIPSIDNPKYISAEEAVWLSDDELVLAISRNGVKRAYPLQIMVWHEIVNDNINQEPILITYCPLCGSGIAYKREVQGEEVEFGTTGKLFNSNLVMYDRKTDTYWTQIEGKAIIGPLAGEVLEPVSIDTTTWGEWRKQHPDTQVLSRDTGYTRDYGRDPYGDYYQNNNLFFPVEHTDDKLHPKTVIFGFVIDEQPVAITEDSLLENNLIEQTVNGVKIRITRDSAGMVKILRLDTGQEIIKERDFYFAWVAFHPDTIII